MLEFKAKNQHLILLNPDSVIVADSQDYLTAHFVFSDDWNNAIKIALFTRDDTNIRVPLDENNNAVVPYTMLQGSGEFDISVFGNNEANADNLVITSSVIKLKVERSGLLNGETFDESVQGLEGGVLHEITGKAAEARAWASSDEVVEDGLYSAKHYSEAAAQSATNAGQSEQDALESKNAAALSAQAAATAASNAATQAAQLAAQQTSEAITQTFSALLNAPYYGYDANGHLIFYYNREV